LKPVLYVMAVAAGLGAANLHYSQPLLPAIAESLGTAISRVSLLPAVTQAGFAIGIVAIVPLADLLERRKLICTLLLLVAAALFLHAAARSVSLLVVAGFLVGTAGVMPQLLTPFASLLAPEGRAGAAVGLVLSGVLTGVLLSKVIAGAVTTGLGWRELYILAGAVSLVLACVLYRVLPQSRAQTKSSYGAILRSSWALFRRQPRLRRHALNGALTFACFMSFWATYAIFLRQEFGWGPDVAGLFGVAGIAGAACAPLAGRAVDRGRFRQVFVFAMALISTGFACLFLAPASIPMMVAGILLVGAGAGFSHAANQATAFSIAPSARGRINSVYMSGYFAGGAVGTLVATQALLRGGWPAVCATGLSFALVNLLLEWAFPCRDLQQPAARADA